MAVGVVVGVGREEEEGEGGVDGNSPKMGGMGHSRTNAPCCLYLYKTRKVRAMRIFTFKKVTSLFLLFSPFLPFFFFPVPPPSRFSPLDLLSFAVS